MARKESRKTVAKAPDIRTVAALAKVSIATGVLRAAYMEGLRVPQDLSVIGLDDIAFAEYALPPLITIRLSRVELARAAFEALRQQAEDPANPEIQREFLVSTSLIVRGSTAPPASGGQ